MTPSCDQYDLYYDFYLVIDEITHYPGTGTANATPPTGAPYKTGGLAGGEQVVTCRATDSTPTSWKATGHYQCRFVAYRDGGLTPHHGRALTTLIDANSTGNAATTLNNPPCVTPPGSAASARNTTLFVKIYPGVHVVRPPGR